MNGCDAQTKAMRIVFAVHGYKPAWRIGGPIISVSSVAERLVQRGHEVNVVTSTSNQDELLDVPVDQEVDVEGVKVYYFTPENILKSLFPGVSYFSRSLGFLYSKKMRRRFDEFVPHADIVHTHLPFVYPTYAAAHAAFRHGKPLIYHQRGVLDPARLEFRAGKKHLYLHFIEKPILRRATRLIALTEAERESYKLLDIRAHCSVIPNGIDTTSYSRSYDPAAMRPLGIREEHRVILFMGRVHPVKGVDVLLDAFIDLHARQPSAVLVLAGPDEFGLEQRFRDQAARAGLGGRVLFPGMVTGPLKRDLLARADIFCLPSVAEGFSMAVLEALASGTAVLLSAGCGFPEVASAAAGRICDRTPRAIATALEAMLEDEVELSAMGERGYELVRTRFSWDRVVDQLVGVYEEAIAEKGAR